MSKKAKQQEVVKKVESDFDNFVGLKSGEYRISYSKETSRASLKKGDDFKVSDCSLYGLKRYASVYYGVPENSWTRIQ